ncbi:MAG: hypothetical protein OQK04_12720 [Kangiellaceae bacterium]|nr:hypothetical protein [Kangiellaceae bacterium]MCW8999564.1 hypothetical protein [Kangiellaceae bacterium]
MIRNTLIIIALSLSLNAKGSEPKLGLYDSLKQLCGKSYTGKTVFPEDPNHSFAGKLLTMTISSCTDSEIRIPFQVGEDKSRTWIISKTPKGLLFKHDHRHKDGTPDEITMYGGYASSNGNRAQISFPADEYTAHLIPAAKTNVWTLSLDKDNKTFTYYLERNEKPRYKAIFNLN